MTGATDAGSLRPLFAESAVLRTFAFALLGRLAYGVLPLCFLFTVRRASGSFALAALSSGAVGFATLAMPVQSRWLDRYGQRKVLPLYAGSFALLLVLGAALAITGAPPVTWPVLGILLGAAAPALGPAMRAQWREITEEGPRRRRAYSLDSIAEEFLYLAGPLIAAAVLASLPAWTGLLLVAALIIGGTAALATSPHQPRISRAAESSPRTASSGSANRSTLVVLMPLLSCLFLFGAASAAIFVSIAALADQRRVPQLAGFLEAAMAAGAVVGGLAWARFGTERTSAALPVLLGYLALTATAAAMTTAHVALFGTALAAGALATSAIYVVAFSVADVVVSPEQRTEASTWVTVAANAGTAAGTAVAGLVTHLSPATGLLLAAALAIGAALAGLRRAPGAPARRTPSDSADRRGRHRP